MVEAIILGVHLDNNWTGNVTLRLKKRKELTLGFEES